MKILVISAAFPPLRAGEADHALHLCERLTQRGHEVHVLTTKRAELKTDVPFKLHPVMYHWLWSDLLRLARFLRNFAPDAILLIYSDRDYDRHPMITFAPAISKSLLPSVPFVTQLETEYISRQTSIVTRAALKFLALVAGPRQIDYVFGTLLSKSDRIIVLSERYLAELSKRFRNINKKGIVIPPPPILRTCRDNPRLARQRGREALGAKSDEFLLAYYGYLYEEKGIETLFKAFKILNDHRCRTRLVMIGGAQGEKHTSSYLMSLHELARELGIENRIIWTGEYSSESDEASLYLHAADACVFPFKHGVTLNRSSLAAAAAHGVPIITTKGKSVETPFVNQDNVLLCLPEQPYSLARAMAAVIDDKRLRERLRAGSLKMAEEHFCWDKAIQRTVAAFDPCPTVN